MRHCALRLLVGVPGGADAGGVGELIAQVDPDTGEVLCSVDKDVAHRDGIWHATIHVWVLDAAGGVLLQQRSWSKEHFPGMWDISAAGHIAPGESGVREVQEELGASITLADLDPVGTLTIEHATTTFINRERPRVYLWHSGRMADSFSFSDGEVIGLATVTVEELKALTAGTAVIAPVWRGEETVVENIEPTALVPLGGAYWSALLAKLR